jgi:hypothetical protein
MQRNSAGHHSMRRSATARSGLWRAAVGVVVAYALVISAVLSGFLQADFFAQAAAGLVGERCHIDAQAAGEDPSAPAGQPQDPRHCSLCTLAAGPALLPVAPLSALLAPPQDGAPAGGNDHDLSWRPEYPGKLPRGPPCVAIAA